MIRLNTHNRPYQWMINQKYGHLQFVQYGFKYEGHKTGNKKSHCIVNKLRIGI